MPSIDKSFVCGNSYIEFHVKEFFWKEDDERKQS